MNLPISSQERMLSALGRASAYPHATGMPTRISTHVSDVFLAGDFAYKVKKPVNLGFLDFTTVASRKQACEDEVRLNRRLAPDVYLGVVPVFESDGNYFVGLETDAGNAHARDYAVKMIRLPQDGMLDRIAGLGGLDPESMRDIARQLSRFHSLAERGHDIDRYGDAGLIASHVRQNFAQIEPFIGRSITRTQLDALRSQAEEFMRRSRPAFSGRIAAGRIVDGHGDLHLKNMCYHRGKVVIFDCIEFSQEYRAGDTIGDIAFLTMDLEALSLPQLANCFLNEYLQQTDDYTGLSVLDFYQSYRACVRGKVISFLLDGGNARSQPDAAADATRYFRLAVDFGAVRRGGLIITSGPAASGKSTIAHQTAGAIGGIVVRSDAVRRHLAGLEPGQHAPRLFGQGIYGNELTEKTYHALLDRARAIVSSGRWAILDATFLSRARRRHAAMLARSLGTAFGVIYCSAPIPELSRRLEQRSYDGRDISDATQAVLSRQLQDIEVPGNDEAPVFFWTGTEDPVPWIRQLRTYE